jgi:hypothetical protein
MEFSGGTSVHLEAGFGVVSVRKKLVPAPLTNIEQIFAGT